MRRIKWIQTLGIALIALVLSGCADRVMVTSFQDITSESKRQGWFYGRQYSSISIPGFISAFEPGTLYSYNPTRGPLTATGVAWGKESLIVSKTIDSGAAQGTVGTIKKKLEEIKSKTTEVVQLRLDMLKQSLNDTVTTGTKPFVIGTTDPATAYQKALGELEALESQLADMVSANGVMIFRWAHGDESKAEAKVSEIASAGGGSSKAGAGYAILNGLRVSTLYVGEDILQQWNDVEDIGFWRSWTQIVTQVAQAKEIAYTTELNLESTFQAELKLDAETVKNIAENWQQEVSVVLSAFSARFQRTANAGVVGNEVITWRKVDWKSPDVSFDPVKLPAHQQGWTTFFQVSTSLKALKKTMGGDQP